MAGLDYEEIIALSEDPSVTFDDVPGRPPTPEEIEQIAALADTVFCQSSLATQIEVVLHWPVHLSARRLALLSEGERAEILACLPAALAGEVVSLLPMGID